MIQFRASKEWNKRAIMSLFQFHYWRHEQKYSKKWSQQQERSMELFISTWCNRFKHQSLPPQFKWNQLILILLFFIYLLLILFLYFSCTEHLTDSFNCMTLVDYKNKIICLKSAHGCAFVSFLFLIETLKRQSIADVKISPWWLFPPTVN